MVPPAGDALRSFSRERRIDPRARASPSLTLISSQCRCFDRAGGAADEDPRAAKLLAVKLECELALPEALVRVRLGLPGSSVPDNHGSGPVFALGDGALKVRVFERMVFDLDRQAFVPRVEAGPGGTAALQYTVEFQARVIVQAPAVCFE